MFMPLIACIVSRNIYCTGMAGSNAFQLKTRFKKQQQKLQVLQVLIIYVTKAIWSWLEVGGKLMPRAERY